jgi:hypothetical protein
MPNLTVPYQPIPQGQQTPATPFMGDVATPTAFGVNVGQAEEGFGKSIAGLGDMLAGQAIARQDLTNQAENDRLDSELMARMGTEHYKFSQMEGIDKAKYFETTYMPTLERIRQEVRAKASNPIVAKRFDSTSLNTLGRTIFNGAGEAGHAAVTAAGDAATLHKQAQIDQGALATNSAQVDSLRQGAGDAAALAAHVHGLGSQAEADARAKAYGQFDYERASGMVSRDLDGAQKLLDTSKEMSAEHKRQLSDQIDARRKSLDSVNIADTVGHNNMDGDGRLLTGEEDLVDQAKARAKEVSSDPALQNTAEAHMRAWYRHYTQEQNLETKQVKQDLTTLVNGNSSIHSLDDVKALPDGRALLARLPKSVVQDKFVGNAVRARDAEESGDAMVFLANLKKNNPTAFLDVEPDNPKYKLNAAQQIAVYNSQRQVAREKPAADMRTKTAFGDIMAKWPDQLAKAYVTGKNKDEDTYNLFTSHLTDELEAWRDTHGGKSPTTDEVQNIIGKHLIEKIQTAPGGMVFGPTMEERFKVHAEGAQEHAAKHPEMTEQEALRDFDRRKALEFYQKAPSSFKSRYQAVESAVEGGYPVQPTTTPISQ